MPSPLMDHRLFKRVSAASATHLVPPSLPPSLCVFNKHLFPPELSPPFLPSASLSVSPTPPASCLLLHHCCLMPACMRAADRSHRWTEKLRNFLSKKLTQMLMNDDVTATLNRHFLSFSLFFFSLEMNILFMFAFFFFCTLGLVWLCRQPV